MCAACVAQGVGYVGTALVGLQVMGARAKAKRRRSTMTESPDSPDSIGSVDPSEAEQPTGV
jgi:hypothetical protein